MNKFFKHMCLVGKHKLLVFKYCLMAGFPFRGLVHDLSKYSPSELFESIKYFNGKKSPLSVSKSKNGYSLAWIHHKGHNKHHFEYYIDLDASVRMPIMPFKYTVEMICDNLAASKVYMGTSWTAQKMRDYLHNRRDIDYINVKVLKVLDTVYDEIEKYGIKKALKKKNLKSIYDSVINSEFLYKCYLGGTCGKSKWREEFVKLLPKNIKCYNPYSKDWNHETEVNNRESKQDSKYLIYVITGETNSLLSVANLVNYSFKCPNRVLACFLKDTFKDMDDNIIDEIELIVKNNKVKTFSSLEDLASYVKEN